MITRKSIALALCILAGFAIVGKYGHHLPGLSDSASNAPAPSPLPTPIPSATAPPLVVTSDEGDMPIGVWQDGKFAYYQQPFCIVSLFKPKRDITAYELARLLPYIKGACMQEADWKALGRARRHLQRMSPGESP